MMNTDDTVHEPPIEDVSESNLSPHETPAAASSALLAPAVDSPPPASGDFSLPLPVPEEIIARLFHGSEAESSYVGSSSGLFAAGGSSSVNDVFLSSLEMRSAADADVGLSTDSLEGASEIARKLQELSAECASDTGGEERSSDDWDNADLPDDKKSLPVRWRLCPPQSRSGTAL